MQDPDFIFEANNYPIEPGIRLIEASAGTGKTFSLAHLVLRLITEKEHSISEILVVSFTRATASEIKSIIGRRLGIALRCLESQEDFNQINHIDKVLQEWLSTKVNSNKNRSHWASLLLEALENIDHADITTIHGFCSRTLRREAIETGSQLRPLLLVDDNQLIKEVAHEYWSKEVLNLDPRHIRGLQKIGVTLEDFVENLMKIDNDSSLRFKLDIPNLDENKPLKDQFNELLKDYWLSFCDEWKKNGSYLENELKNYAEQLRAEGISDTKPYVPKPRKKRDEVLSSWIEEINLKNHLGNGFSIPFYEDILNQKEILGNYFHPKNLYQLHKRNNLVSPQSFRKKLLKSIAKLWDGPAEVIWNHGLSRCLNLLESKRLENGTINNSELLKALDPDKQNNLDGLGTQNELFKKLSTRYKVALIDEFQDTDQVQWRLLKRIFSNRERHLLIMVGDPKQAIYKFRGGDLNTYLKARIEADRTDVLLTNFRTTPLLMEGLNKLMSKGLVRSKLKVPSLTANSDIIPLQLKSDQFPLQLLEIADSQNNKNSLDSPLLTKTKLEEQIPKIVTNHLIHLLNQHQQELEPDDICILVNNHNQAEHIRKALTLVGLPSRLVNKGDVLKSEAAHILQRFLNCLASPGNSGNLKLVACSCLIQWTTHELETAEQDGTFDQLANRFREWSKNLETLGLLGCLAELLDGKTIANLSGRGRLLSDLNQSAQLVQEEIHRQGLDAKGAARWLRRQRHQQTEQIPDDRQPHSDVTESAINVITIHRSKGLQYKVVVCPYLWEAPPLAKGPLWRVQEKQNWHLSVSAGIDEKADASNEAQKEMLQEYERLAYVALTRSQKHLIIIWGRALKQEGNPLISFLFGPAEMSSKIKDLTHRKMIEWLQLNDVPISIKSTNTKEISPSWTQMVSKVQLQLGPSPQHLLDKSWGRYSYSSWITKPQQRILSDLNSPEFDEGKDSDSNRLEGSFNPTIKTIFSTSENYCEENNPFVDFPKGPLAGDCLHQILEKLDFQIAVKSKKTSSLILEELRKFGIDSKYLSTVQKGLNRVLNIPLGKDLGMLCLNKIKEKNRIHEMKFDLPISSQGKPINSKDISNAFLKNPEKRFGNSYSTKISNLTFLSKGFLTGSIDLVFADNENLLNAKWWVADWKSNWLGVNREGLISCGPKHYDKSSMEEEMVLHHYPLQAHLYLLALHKLLKWRLPQYSPDRHLGGYIYFFLRGIPSEGYMNTRTKKENCPGLIIENAPIDRILEIEKIFEHGGQ